MATLAQWLLCEGVSSIPLRSEATFSQLWDDGRLEYVNGSSGGDLIDRANARLASSTLERGLRLLIVLPVDSHQRAPLLFGSALVSQWWDRKIRGLDPGRVIYFGTTIGIREHLSCARVRRLPLNAVFPQSKVISNTGRFRSAAHSYGSELPEVVCAYSPADPAALLEAYRPAWIAIDCGSEGRIRWLPQLLAHAKDSGIPIIAWSQNPLSEVIRDFEQFSDDQVIRWPFDLPTTSGLMIEPIIVGGPDDHSQHCLQDAYRSLAKATAGHTSGRLAKDALSITWRLQRSLEQLTIPLDLFESETGRYWGMQPIGRLFAGAQHFVSELEPVNRPLSECLSDVLSFHDQVIETLHESNPPLWDALSQLCIEDVPTDGERLIVFSSRARKQIFSLALLSRFNISEGDLEELGVSLSSLTELKGKSSTPFPNTPHSHHSRSALLTCLPSTRLSPHMLPLMLLGGLDILVFPFQTVALSKWIGELNASLRVSPATAEKVIEARSGRVSSPAVPARDPVLTLGGGRRFSLSIRQATKAQSKRPMLPTLDATTEIRWFMDDDEEQEPERSGTGASQIQHEDVWTQEAVEIHVNGGWYGLFPLEDKLNVVIEGGASSRTEERFVRSLRVGDRILFIHGQKRQSLYDLVISRVHNHSAMEIHLALINKWQEELAQSFRVRQMTGWTVDDVLTKIRERGSSITSHQTIRLWLSGQVLAPEDPKDLLRLARSMRMPFVEQYHDHINRAARRIRGLHRGLSTRLNHWLQEQVTGGSNTASEVFDEELGLSFRDFQDSLAIHTVERVERVSGLFLRGSLGTFEQEQVQHD